MVTGEEEVHTFPIWSASLSFFYFLLIQRTKTIHLICQKIGSFRQQLFPWFINLW